MKLKQKNIIFNIQFLIILISLFPVFIFSQTDTLNTIDVFDAPSSSCWGITYDGENFWISDDSLSCIYQTDYQGNIIQTYYYPNLVLKGMTFHENKLLVVNSFAHKDTLINNSSTYNIYSIYEIDQHSGEIIDSINFYSNDSYPLNENRLLGLGYLQSNLYATYDGGWGACTYEIDPENVGLAWELCCVHPVGLTNINGNLWCLRISNNNGAGGYIKELEYSSEGMKGLNEKEPWYRIDCEATDLTYDGENIWICDYTNKKIKKLSKISTSIIQEKETNPIDFKIDQNYPNPFNPSTVIKYSVYKDSKIKIVIYDVNGQIITELVNEYKNIGNYTATWTPDNQSSGIYFCKFIADGFVNTQKLTLKK